MIEEKTVRDVARLARIGLTDDEIERMRSQLGKILETMEELKALDTRDVPPTSHVLGLTDVLRPDEARPFAHVQALLDGAPRREGGYFRVPKVIE
ncbi:MAG: Asp-tRNA(Asn)/Glu-tRNA(Gln) amidotransferase subunit GatC [Elusimicrobia bacterium]|nr:Asp-tRNA(Asn)/Glu-tRNA(Gln) amidotransferase subunit GatC [Elusimicrobiota bacterium]